MINYTYFKSALKNLEQFWQHYQRSLLRHDEWEEDEKRGERKVRIEMEKMAIIQAFEVCYATLMKGLYRYLIEEMGITDRRTGAKIILRHAHKNELLHVSIDQWFRYVAARNMTSHEYGVKNVDDVLALMADFINDAINLYQNITGQSWD